MNETSGPKRPFLGEHEDRWRRLEKEEEVGWSEEKGGVGWFVTFNLHWSPMALEKKGGEGDITHTHRQTHKHTGNDAGNCCTWMSTHTHTQGHCQRTYGSCLCTQTLSVRSQIGSERTIWQWTVTPLIRGDIAAPSGQPGSLYYQRPYHKFSVFVFLLISAQTHGGVLKL